MNKTTTHDGYTRLQYHRIAVDRQTAPGGKRRWYKISFNGGKGGDAIDDMNKGRASATVLTWAILAAIYNEYDFDIASLRVGDNDHTIASSAEVIITIASGEPASFVKSQQDSMNQWLREEYGPNDPDVCCTIEKCEKQDTIINPPALEALMECLEQTPQGIIEKSQTATVSNNVGRINIEDGHILVSTYTYSTDKEGMERASQEIHQTFASFGATTSEVE